MASAGEKKRKLSFAWLKPPPVPADGSMSLYDHLRELRYRLVFAVVAIVVGMVVCGIFYDPYLVDLVMHPINTAIDNLEVTHPHLNVQPINNDVTAPIMMFIKIIAMGGAILTAPVWLYQLWAFIVPGLLANEKKWARLFVGVATPLFLAGVATGYLIMPKGVGVLVGFTPESANIDNLVPMETFIGFLMRVVLVFGISYLIPLVMLMLNFVGVLSAAQMKKFRPFVILVAFIFAAVANPSTDPFSMLAIALPMTVLLLASEQIAKIREKRIAARGDDDPTAHDRVLQELTALDEKEKAEREALDSGRAAAAESK